MTRRATISNWANQTYPIPGGSGGGGSGTLPAASVIAWWVDPQGTHGGNDANNGQSPLTPIRTFAHLRTLWGIFPTLNPPLDLIAGVKHVDINVMSNYNTQDPIDFNGVRFGLDVCVRAIAATIPTFRTSTVTTFTPIVRTGASGGNPNLLNDLSVGSWEVGDRIQFTSGAATGGVAFIVHDLGGGTAEISNIMLLAPMALDNAAALVTPNPSPGDTYIVQRQADALTLSFAQAVIVSEGVTTLSEFQTFDTIDFNIVGSGGLSSFSIISSPTTSAATRFQRCFINCVVQAAANLSPINTFFKAGAFIEAQQGQVVFMRGGAVASSIIVGRPGTTLAMDLDVYVTGEALSVVGEGAGLFIGSAGFFHCVTDAIKVASGGLASQGSGDQAFFFNGNAVYGNGNGGTGVNVVSGGTFLFATIAPVVTGLLGDFRMGGEFVAFHFDNASATWQPPGGVATGGAAGAGWANLVGVLANFAHNPIHSCRILKST